MKTKKKMMSLLLAVCMVLTLMPTTALAEETESARSSKTVITTVHELQQFAKAVDNGEYDDKTDAVVSLEADLDLTGVAWKPIGSVFDGDGNLLHYFSGKFYGNGHTISNLDFSENYGKTEYPSFGFFSEVYGAEISGLTIQGKLDVSNSGYVFFGTVAGVAENSKISDCVSDVSFTDTNKYINGPAALCGYAINSTIEHCQNKGNFSVTTDTTSLQMGGIVGVADNSTVQYCANTGDMTSWTPCTGGIVGQLFQNSKIINCYSTGKIVPLGKGTTDFGGIAGTVGAGTEIRHCYFAGEMDLSQYTATTPYKRLGGIAGGVSSDTPVFENNYFVKTENVPACFKYQDAGTEKTLDFMKTEDFFNEITAAGGNYRFNSNGTPLLPAPKYTVSFVVTPAELANVVIKVNGQEVANPVDLEAGTYTVTASADGYNSVSKEITITADTATHTQTIPFTKKSSGGSYVPVQKPEIITGEGGKTELTDHGSTLVITPDAGMQIENVLVNGKEVKVSDHKVKGLKTGDKVEVTFSKIPPTKAQIDKAIKTTAGNLKLTVRTSKTPKKNIKAVVKQDAALKSLLQEVKEAGYTVKYKFYRSESKKSGYAARLTKTTGVYLNTEGQANAKYYYKAKLQILDREGKTIAETSLKQCRFGVRIWTKGQK